MLSIAALAHKKQWHFKYYTKSLPKVVDEGNFSEALKLGMEVFEVPHSEYRKKVEELHLNFDEKSLVIAQGGADKDASEGLELLAQEIRDFKKSSQISKLNVITPSGTGTTAYFLAKHLDEDAQVYTTPCVGSTAYLLEEMHYLGNIPSNLHMLETEKKYHFAKPYREFYDIYSSLLESSKIEFDLIYAPKMFQALKENFDKIEGDILYVHSGGVLGNRSMIKRYEYKRLI